MIAGRCPTCAKAYSIAGIAALPTFPFCSDRCRLIDLGRWIDGAYAIPAAPEAPDADADEASEDADPDEK